MNNIIGTASEDIEAGDILESFVDNSGAIPQWRIRRAQSEPTMAEMLAAQEEANDKLKAEVARLEGEMWKGAKVIAEKDKVIYELNCLVAAAKEDVRDLTRRDGEWRKMVEEHVKCSPTPGEVERWKLIESEAKRVHEMKYVGTNAQYEAALTVLLDRFEIPF